MSILVLLQNLFLCTRVVFFFSTSLKNNTFMMRKHVTMRLDSVLYSLIASLKYHCSFGQDIHFVLFGTCLHFTLPRKQGQKRSCLCLIHNIAYAIRNIVLSSVMPLWIILPFHHHLNILIVIYVAILVSVHLHH